MPERLKGADCKSAGDYLRWFESSSTHRGKVAEWLNAPVLKTVVAVKLPGVRIPPFPFKILVPNQNFKSKDFYYRLHFRAVKQEMH